MNVSIYSREAIEELIDNDFPANTAVISFYDPKASKGFGNFIPVDYKNKCQRIFYVCVYDIDIEILADYGLTFETYFPEATELAEFIVQSYEDGLDIICQCEYGQSRSAACAAAIQEYFYNDGISVFADYQYYPNQMIFHKVFHALEKISPDMDILIVTDEHKELLGNFYEVGILAYIDLSNGEVKRGSYEITVYDNDETYGTPEGIGPKQIYHIKAIKQGNYVLLTKIVESDVKNPVLERLLEEYNKPVIIKDNTLGTIFLQREHFLFTGIVRWSRYKISISVFEKEITSEVMKILHRVDKDLEMVTKHIQSNVRNHFVNCRLDILSDGKYRLDVDLYKSYNKKINVSLTAAAQDGVSSYVFNLDFGQKLYSVQEFYKVLEILNTLDSEKSAVNPNSKIGIWWYTDNGEIWDESIPIYKGVLCGIYIQYSATENHLTLWSSVVKKYVKDIVQQQNIIAKGYKSIERGRVIYNTATMKFEIICSEKMFYDTNFRKSIAAYYQLAENSYEFVQLNHYYKIELTGNPMLDEYIENSQF